MAKALVLAFFTVAMGMNAPRPSTVDKTVSTVTGSDSELLLVKTPESVSPATPGPSPQSWSLKGRGGYVHLNKHAKGRSGYVQLDKLPKTPLTKGGSRKYHRM